MELLAVPFQSRGKAKVVEHRGIQIENQRARLLNEAIDRADFAVEPLTQQRRIGVAIGRRIAPEALQI